MRSSRGTQGRPDDFLLQHHHALSLLAAGNPGDYRRVCAQLIEQFRATSDARIANNVASLCILLPDALSDHGPCLHLAQLAASAAGGYLEQNTLGTALYRAGQARAAIDQLARAIELHGAGGTPYDWLFLAMAHHDLGQIQEARRQFSRAKDWLERADRGEQANDPYLGSRLSWVRRIELRHLLEEAEARLRP